MNEALVLLYKRDLERLKAEIEAFNEDSNLWRLEGEIKNTAGNLALHLAGNIQHFIGHVLGGSDYKRDRDYEFSANEVERSVIIKEVEQAILAIETYIPQLDTSTFNDPFPIQVFKEPYTIFQMLVHLQGHLNYHLGQINYLRRILD